MNFNHEQYVKVFLETASSQMNLNSSTDDGVNENKSGGDKKKIDYVHSRIEEVLNGKTDSTPKDNTINLKD